MRPRIAVQAQRPTMLLELELALRMIEVVEIVELKLRMFGQGR